MMMLVQAIDAAEEENASTAACSKLISQQSATSSETRLSGGTADVTSTDLAHHKPTRTFTSVQSSTSMSGGLSGDQTEYRGTHQPTVYQPTFTPLLHTVYSTDILPNMANQSQTNCNSV